MDERVSSDIKKAHSIGYTIFWFGIFAVLLYRWYYLSQTLWETLDIFAIWLVASITQFFTLALKGIPITYPVKTNRKEELYFLIFAPILTGTLSALLLVFREGVELSRIIGGFAASAIGTLLLFMVYKVINYIWEKRNTE